MKAWIPFTLMLAVGSAAHADANCTYPRSPDSTPDGATATKDQMIAAKRDFDRYNSEMNAYLDCIKQQIEALPKDRSKLKPDDKKKVDDQERILDQKNNSAVDELQANVGKFNEQLKIFKAKAASQ